MHYQSFLDHISIQGCFLLPEYSNETLEIYRNIHNSQEASLTVDTWISYIHAIAFCKDMDIEIPAELLSREKEFDDLGWFE